MRLIDADKLYIPPEEMNAKMAVAHAPTVDAVCVTRCKDCKHFNPFRKHDGFCSIDGMLWDNNHFCKCGEHRKEDT